VFSRYPAGDPTFAPMNNAQLVPGQFPPGFVRKQKVFNMSGTAVQLAKAAGTHVVAIAGGEQRTNHAVRVLGADAAVDYRDPAFPERLREAAREGIDVFFDNVGGRQLTLALPVMKNFGRVVLCGP
jgi:NADPH-dependent curcumin reductase CurA